MPTTSLILFSSPPRHTPTPKPAGLIDEIITAPRSPSSTSTSTSTTALLQAGALSFIQKAQPGPLVVRRTKDRRVSELVSVRGTALDACRALAAKELKIAPVKRCVRGLEGE
jgi:hypothetical protein